MCQLFLFDWQHYLTSIKCYGTILFVFISFLPFLMKLSASQIIGFIGTSALLFALSFESLTGIGAALDANRANVEARVRLTQTSEDTGNTDEEAVKANMNALDQYNATVKTERRIYSL